MKGKEVVGSSLVHLFVLGCGRACCVSTGVWVSEVC
jgi:hypothetical protein